MGIPAFVEVMRQHGDMLARIAATYERRPAQRKDLEQEIAIAVWRALPSCREPGALKSFVARIAHNRSVNHVIAQQEDRRMTELGVTLVDPEAAPEATTEREQAKRRLREAVQKLPLALKQAVSLALEGFTTAEVAGILGVAPNTIDVRISRARQALRAALEERHEQVG